MSRFAGIDMLIDRMSGKSTIWTFCYLLEKHSLGDAICETVKVHLKPLGMAMKQGTIIDVTLIAIPSSTKNQGR